MDQNTVFVGKQAPNFIEKAIMPDNSIENKFNLKDYAKGGKLVVFFYPLNFTFVCPSEIIACNNRIGEFASRNTKIVLVSVDSHFSHLSWKNTPLNKGGIGNIQIPMVSDLNKKISQSYNVLNDEGISLRGTFFIDENFIVRHILVNDPALGRDIDELINVIDKSEHNVATGEVCPAGWRKGQEGMTASQQGAADYLNSHAEKL